MYHLKYRLANLNLDHLNTELSPNQLDVASIITEMGLFSLLLQNPLAFIVVAAVLVIAITIHEFAHAWTADKLGDPTPRLQDRVTLNPLAHLDPLGTLMIVLLGFGWGKPVMFDPYNLKNPMKDTALIALAGPVSNLLLALLIVILMPLISLTGISVDLIQMIGMLAISYNVMLAIFNLVPIHPLDGGKIAVALLPHRLSLEYDDFMQKYGPIVLILLIFPFSGRSLISTVIAPIISIIVDSYAQLLIAFTGMFT